MCKKKSPDANERERILTAMVGALWCFLIDEDLATPAELEALTRQTLKIIDEQGTQKLIDELINGLSKPHTGKTAPLRYNPEKEFVTFEPR